MYGINSFLFIPFNKTKYFYNELIGIADAIIVDFEDSVDFSLDNLDILKIKESIKNLNNKKVLARVGINEYELFKKIIDINNFDGIMIPKFSNKIENIQAIEELTEKNKEIYLLVENARGLIDLKSVIEKYKINGIFFGSEDYISDLNAIRTENNLQYARAKIINISKAFNVACYDTIYPFLEDEEGFKDEVQLAFDMGFDGKMAINPRQLLFINNIFKISQQKIEEYKILIDKYNEYTRENNTRVMVIDGRVIEPPHIIQIETIVKNFEGRKING